MPNPHHPETAPATIHEAFRRQVSVRPDADALIFPDVRFTYAKLGRLVSAFAVKLGKLVSDQLLSFSDIEQKIVSPENLQKLMPVVETHVDDFLRNKLADVFPVISMFIGEKTLSQLKGHFLNELETLFPILMKRYMGHLQSELDLEKIVTEKVSGFSSDKLEEILMSIMSKEFRFVEILGGVLGFIIGLVQVAITVWLG